MTGPGGDRGRREIRPDLSRQMIAEVSLYCVICRNVTMHPETVKNPYKYVTIQTS